MYKPPYFIIVIGHRVLSPNFWGINTKSLCMGCKWPTRLDPWPWEYSGHIENEWEHRELQNIAKYSIGNLNNSNHFPYSFLKSAETF